MASKTKAVLLGYAASGILVLAGTAQWVGAEEPMSIDFGATDAVFQPNVVGEAMTLTVSCEGGAYIQQEYEGTAAVSFILVDQDGLPIEDGQCNYEVHIHPAVDKAAMKAAEEFGDDSLAEQLAQLEQMQTVVVSGSFEVVDGQIALPDNRAERKF